MRKEREETENRGYWGEIGEVEMRPIITGIWSDGKRENPGKMDKLWEKMIFSRKVMFC